LVVTAVVILSLDGLTVILWKITYSDTSIFEFT
jgi:hypothetical protein